MMPEAILRGVFSGIMFCFSIITAINWQSFVSSSLMARRLQYLSMNASGFVLQKFVVSELSKLDSSSLMILTAFFHPLVALVLSRLKILAICFGMRGQLCILHAI